MYNVYLSRSFRKEDQKFYDFLEEILTRSERLKHYNLNVYDSYRKEARPFREKIKEDISSAHVVVSIFSRRGKLQKGGYSTAPWVLGESGYALACKKKFLLFKEEGVDAERLGIISAEGLDYVDYSRREIGKVTLKERIEQYVVSLLEGSAKPIVPDKIYRQYVKIITHMPDGYGLIRTQVKAEYLQDVANFVEHEIGVFPEEPGQEHKIPTLDQMAKNFQKTPYFMGSSEIFNFQTEDEGVYAGEFDTEGKNIRKFKVNLPPKQLGKAFRYEFLYGSRYMFRTDHIKNESSLKYAGIPVDEYVIVLKVRKGTYEAGVNPILKAFRSGTDDLIYELYPSYRELSGYQDVYVFKTYQPGIPCDFTLLWP